MQEDMRCKVGEVPFLFEQTLPAEQVRQMSPLTLAYLGDAIYEQMIRTYLVMGDEVSADHFHKAGVRFANAKTQAQAVWRMLSPAQAGGEAFLTDEEQAMFRRGKNAKVGTIPKSCKPQEYHLATGFECLMGYLYLSGQRRRCEEIFGQVLHVMEKEV